MQQKKPAMPQHAPHFSEEAPRHLIAEHMGSNVGHHRVVSPVAERKPLGHIDNLEVDSALREPLLRPRNRFKRIIRRSDVEAGAGQSSRVVAGSTPKFENPPNGGPAQPWNETLRPAPAPVEVGALLTLRAEVLVPVVGRRVADDLERRGATHRSR